MEVVSNEATFEAEDVYTELLLGCGVRRDKEFCYPPPEDPEHEPERAEFQNLITLDINPACNPDVVHDLNDTALPFQDCEFDEIHAYEVLEHTGTQGDVDFFFDQFNEFHRILKPGGLFLGSVPMWDSPWAWADPGHRRVIAQHSLLFLDPRNYEARTDDSPMADYGDLNKGNWQVVGVQETEHRFYFVMEAIK